MKLSESLGAQVFATGPRSARKRSSCTRSSSYSSATENFLRNSTHVHVQAGSCRLVALAALIVLAAGLLAGLGSVRLASGIIAVLTLLLVEKSRLHALVQRIDDVGLRSGVRFAVMAFVVLPLLPEGPYGPLGGIRPREIWALVLFFSGLSFAGYVARRVAGPGHGYLVTGLLGGLVSSTNVTLTFARTSRTDLPAVRALAFPRGACRRLGGRNPVARAGRRRGARPRPLDGAARPRPHRPRRRPLPRLRADRAAVTDLYTARLVFLAALLVLSAVFVWLAVTDRE